MNPLLRLALAVGGASGYCALLYYVGTHGGFLLAGPLFIVSLVIVLAWPWQFHGKDDTAFGQD